jgi:ankyrin repeat protein
VALAPQAIEGALDALLAAGADINAQHADGETALIAAVKGGHTRSVERLCAAGARVEQTDDRGRSALRWLASLYDIPDAARVLIDNGADVNRGDDDGTPLTCAAYLGSARTVDVRLAAGADPNLSNRRLGATPLMMAAERGRTDIVRRLIGAGAVVDHRDPSGWTALMFASREGHMPVVQLLIGRGADVRAVTPAGDTPLNLAQENGNDDVVRILTEGGAI